MFENALPAPGASLIRLALATGVGLFVGLERAWAGKAVGARSFGMLALLGAVAGVTGSRVLLALGGLFVLWQAAALALTGVRTRHSIGLTTAPALFVTFVAGVVVGRGPLVVGVGTGVATALLLAGKREFRALTDRVDRDEIQSTAQFALLAFVVYPALPDRALAFGVNPREVWVLVVAVSAIGFANYLLIRRYEGRGLAVSGFVGGLVSSTAVVAEIASRVEGAPGAVKTAVGVTLLANAAMFVRNLALVAATAPEVMVAVAPPLAAMTVVAALGAFAWTDWSASVGVSFETPFDLRNAVEFGVLFVAVLVGSEVARVALGSEAFVAASSLAGAVSSASAVAAAVRLLVAGKISTATATASVLGASTVSVFVKVAFAALADRTLVKPMVVASAGTAAVGVAAYAAAFVR